MNIDMRSMFWAILGVSLLAVAPPATAQSGEPTKSPFAATAALAMGPALENSTCAETDAAMMELAQTDKPLLPDHDSQIPDRTPKCEPEYKERCAWVDNPYSADPSRSKIRQCINVCVSCCGG